MEFLETFEVHHNIVNSTAPDHIVTREEFEEYYNNISGSIENDQYFELMINNAWKMNEADRTYQKGWAGEDTKGKSVSQAYGGKAQTASQGSRPQNKGSSYGSAQPERF